MSLESLNRRFIYRSDGKRRDTWEFMDPAATILYGDCEDYSLYVAKELLSEGSNKQFWINLFKRKFEIWFVNAQGNTGGHAVLVSGNKSIDNWSKKWISLDKMKSIHDFKHRYWFPVVAWKLFKLRYLTGG